jgi:hypothetical protein
MLSNLIKAIAVMALLSGCASAPDKVSLYMLNERLSKIENKNDIPSPNKSIRGISQNEDCVYVWITVSTGGKYPVKIIKVDDYFVGPRGEYYGGVPTQEMLYKLYGF